MWRSSLFILLALTSGASAGAVKSAEASYQEARASYYALKNDGQKRKLRHQWLSVAKKFDAVASLFPKSDRAPDALFTAAELYADLSRFSGQESDLRSAMLAHQKLVDGYPKHKLADDALAKLVHIHMDRKGDLFRAKELLRVGLKRVILGDKKKELMALKASLAQVAAPVAKVQPKPKKNPLPVPLREALSEDERPTEDASKTDLAQTNEGELIPEKEALDAVDEKEVASNGAVSSTLTKLQEKLRDVRVGEGTLVVPDESEEATTAKERLKGLPVENSEVSLADQLGLKVRRIVLDSGHGGHDSGAVGPRGTKEKDVTLAITLKLAKLLEAAGFEVEMTRQDDTFVPLEERTRTANDLRGDLFISIHCNASPNRKTRGTETYTLNTSADRYAIRLAARENASSEKGISDLQYILADLATKANTDESNRLAQKVQSALVSSLKERHDGVRDLGHKEALFFVLLGARMPAILVETAFISNPEEEARLASAPYQAEVAEAIAKGVKSFVSDKEKVARAE